MNCRLRTVHWSCLCRFGLILRGKLSGRALTDSKPFCLVDCSSAYVCVHAHELVHLYTTKKLGQHEPNQSFSVTRSAFDRFNCTQSRHGADAAKTLPRHSRDTTKAQLRHMQDATNTQLKSNQHTTETQSRHNRYTTHAQRTHCQSTNKTQPRHTQDICN